MKQGSCAISGGDDPVDATAIMPTLIHHNRVIEVASNHDYIDGKRESQGREHG